MKYLLFFISFFLGTQLNGSDSDRAPRLDAPPVTSPISVVVPSLDLGAVLQILSSINCKIGNVNQDVCEDTILSVLGDACAILGISISEALAILLDCCISGTDDLIDVFTVLQDIKDTITECCSTMTEDFQFTWTILADLNDTITDCCSTMTTDFQFTWTILADLKDTLTECCADLEANFCNPIFIRQSDFDPAGSTPYVINSPGVYKLAEDITYNPAGAGTTAITINSSNVILDLQCFMLEQGNAALTTNGIVVSTGMTDFVIQNGHIANFTGSAVIVSTNCSRFQLRDFICVNIGGTSVVFLNGSGGTIEEGSIDNIQILESSNGTSSSALSMILCTDLRVTNCIFNQNTATVNFNGISVNSSNNCTFENIEIQNNIAAGVFSGIDSGGSFICTFRNVTVSNNTGDQIFGFSPGGLSEYYNCRVLLNSATSSFRGFLVNGLGNGDNLFSKCEVAANDASGIGATNEAFSLSAAVRNLFIECIARRNTAPNSTEVPPSFGAVGFHCAANFCTFQRCLAEDQDAGSELSNSVGFFIDNAVSSVVEECQSYRQNFGFFLDPLNSIDNIFTKNIAAKNSTNYSQLPVGSTQNAADISAINGSLTVPWTNVGIN